MNKYRTHLCSQLNKSNLNDEVILSGWVDTIRDHGNLIFIDLRDNYGITQCIIDKENPNLISCLDLYFRKELMKTRHLHDGLVRQCIGHVVHTFLFDDFR